ncbi:MAG: hypothetical protein QOJ00_2652 [Actinomycetota bacterium]|jgi:hypothetical protein
MKFWGVATAVIAALLAAVPGHAQAAPAGVRAGVGVVDATWNVGASAGQYASSRPGLEVDDWADDLANLTPPTLDPALLLSADSDPNLHATKRQPSYGVQSRLSVRAIVIAGTSGAPIALLKSDNYLAQDMLVRRVGQLLATAGSHVTADHILYSATHNHNSPYYTTAAPGPWLFQDVMDLRMFEYQARAMAQAIEHAEANLKPVRVGATTVAAGGDYRNAPGGAIADDGSPSGYPQYENDNGLVVMRFDDISGATPKPLAVWMNYGVHPESLDGYNLISGDYIAPLERFVQRDLNAPLVFSQGDVGSSEPAEDLNDRIGGGIVRAFAHQGYAQAERHARFLADRVVAGFNEIGANHGTIPWSSNFPVAMFDGWVPGPVSHPYPAVSNCRTEPTVEGNPGVPVAGLPDCERPIGDSNDNASQTFETMKKLGLPVPEHYDAPSAGILEENARIHLQAVRLGDILLASCSCEPQVDLIKNLESRTDATRGNIYDGFDWSPYCDQKPDTSWRCPNPGLPQAKVFNDRSLVVTDAAYRRMVAQVHNDANGWDAAANAATANAEPADPAAIKGNFTKEEIQSLGAPGYKLTVGLGHTGDYNGYTVSYRVFMSFDHYRKALTSYGPHTADYMVTRLVRMAAALQGAPLPKDEPLAVVAVADEARQQATAQAVGRAASEAYDAWNASLPVDAGSPEIVGQPKSINRFDAATVKWRGGNNDVDQPVVRVERLVGKTWTAYADQTGEVQTVLALPKGIQSQIPYRTNRQEWLWTANFEAADFFPRNIAAGQVPTGSYRFVINGRHRTAAGPKSYALTSRVFSVRPWEGVRVDGVRVERNGAVSFTAGATYPRTYKSSIAAIHDDGGRPICKTCTFRGWASNGDVRVATVSVHRSSGRTFAMRAKLVNGRWTANVALRRGDIATIKRGSVVDENGEFNGAAVEITA